MAPTELFAWCPYYNISALSDKHPFSTSRPESPNLVSRMLIPILHLASCIPHLVSRIRHLTPLPCTSVYAILFAPCSKQGAHYD